MTQFEEGNLCVFEYLLWPDDFHSMAFVGKSERTAKFISSAEFLSKRVLFCCNALRNFEKYGTI